MLLQDSEPGSLTANHTTAEMESRSTPSQRLVATPARTAAIASFPRVEECMSENCGTKIERHLHMARYILDKLEAPLHEAKDNMDAARFLKSVETLKEKKSTANALIGVVGNTGSGKSSVTNALLDEEMIVPTNCMRACTAVITEISYNYSDDPNKRYRAEVEFISAAEWAQELSVIYGDLVNSNGEVSRDCSNPETDAGVGWAKFKAVYPQQTKEMLVQTDAQALASLPAVCNILGTTRQISNASPGIFYEKLQKYIDSKEKDTGDDSQHRKKRERKPMELWPLVKVVRIYTKAEALSTGATIVDLPGAHDSNAARAAVAEKYIDKCTGLWIVAPISRAVDDKTAQTLLGQSFRMQLKYDGSYSKITFICSKTDDILVTEAVKSLHLEDEVERCQVEIDRTTSELDSHKLSLNALEKHKEDDQDKLERIRCTIELWEELSERHKNGAVVYAPSNNPKKRKVSARLDSSRKKRLLHDHHSDPSSSSSSSDSEDDEFVVKKEGATEADANKQPLTTEDIRSELERLKAEKAQLKQKRKADKVESKAIENMIERQDRELVKQESALKSMCIQGRNNYSGNAIRQQFANGIKELDQDAAMQENDELFDPDEDLRDYDEVAASLPVFCVSSRAYQKKCGRLEKDEKILGFPGLEETGIPQLQRHTKQLTESARISNGKEYLKEFSYIINSLNLWSKDHSGEVKLSDGEKSVEVERLRDGIEKLRKALHDAAFAAVQQCRDILAHHLFDKFESAIETAAEGAVDIASAWGQTKNDGGLPYSTYKAICRRDGNFSGVLGPKNLNDELAMPLKEALAINWERVFARRIPNTLKKLTATSRKLLDGFHNEVKDRMQAKVSSGSLNMLWVQIRHSCNAIENLIGTFTGEVMFIQRGASREFIPVITHKMAPAYKRCEQEWGTGSFARMKEIMSDHVTSHGHLMFHEATSSVRSKMERICDDMDRKLIRGINKIINDTNSGYYHVNVGEDLAKVSEIARDKISAVLSNVDELFKMEELSSSPAIAVKIEGYLGERS